MSHAIGSQGRSVFAVCDASFSEAIKKEIKTERTGKGGERMKIKDLAAELNLTGSDVLEKAKSMGIAVTKISDELSDIDATAVRNTVMKSGAHAETKVVRAKAKKSESTSKTGEPKVTVKAANIKLPEMKKTSKAAAKGLRKNSDGKAACR